MELLNGIDLASMGFVALVTFGAVAALNFWKKQSTKANFVWSVLIAFALSFVPADVGGLIANRIKDALAVALSLNGLYQGLSRIAMKAAGITI
jgi:hypothetical protein